MVVFKSACLVTCIYNDDDVVCATKCGVGVLVCRNDVIASASSNQLRVRGSSTIVPGSVFAVCTGVLFGRPALQSARLLLPNLRLIDGPLTVHTQGLVAGLSNY